MVKRWFQSKTIWWNIAMFIMALLLDKPLTFASVPTILIAASLVNLYLRFKTTEACKL